MVSDLTDKHVNQRDVGFVFQHYALFKHMTVFDNIAFGLNVRKKRLRPSKKEIEVKVNELLELVKLVDLPSVIQANFRVVKDNVSH